jgi:hypothetical protein
MPPPLVHIVLSADVAQDTLNRLAAEPPRAPPPPPPPPRPPRRPATAPSKRSVSCESLEQERSRPAPPRPTSSTP